MAKTLTAILIGAGNRGKGYTDIMSELDGKYKVVAVAEPIDSRREYIKEKHGLPEEMCFTDYHPLLELGKIADLAIVSTMDQLHFEPAMMAISLKYDLLLEKPVSNNPEECLKIAKHAEEMGVNVLVCHVLRYSDMFIQLKQLINDGAVGDIVSINHEECVGNVHQSHSFVRGNWGNSGRSSCMLLQKSCHDMDILQWLIGKKCKKVQSFGTLSYFKKENAPEGAPEYCIEGCPVGDTCPYNAVKLYLSDTTNDWFRSTCARENNPTDEQVEKAIRTTQYGKCVFKCDNDVVDHQTVNMLFEDDITVTFTMNAFNKGGRFIHIMGTKGEIRAAIDGKTPISVYNFETKQTVEHPLVSADGISGGHGGGDTGIINTLYAYLTGVYNGFSVSGITTSVENHLIVFAAEESRATNRVIDLEEYAASLQ
ncbi:MAG: Gfo/Idh/MocA family oxidoreductase [Lachnospiraceae bacterium]|nr:Gfo/Idh/MocA family oxidoreductase [Lachnospiraceae bacterium]